MARSELEAAPSRTPKIIAWILVIFWAAVIFTASSIPGSGFPSHPDIMNSFAHFGEYLIFGVLLTRALAKSSTKLLFVAILGFVIGSLYGASDELHQLLANAGRQADVVDWAVDTAGALVGAVATIWVISSRKVKASRARDGQ